MGYVRRVSDCHHRYYRNDNTKIASDKMLRQNSSIQCGEGEQGL